MSRQQAYWPHFQRSCDFILQGIGPQCVRYFSVFSTPSSDYYKVLGVARNASDVEIRKSFIEKCFKLHPDKVKAQGEEYKEEATKHFIELKEAYDVLSDPVKKMKYEEVISRPFGGRRDAFYNYKRHQEGAKSTVSDNDYYEYYNINTTTAQEGGNFRRRRRPGSNNIIKFTASSWEKFQADLEDALNKAIQGPSFYRDEANGKLFPDEFECEESTVEGSTRDLLSIVSGRQYLGVISIDTLSLPGNEASNLLQGVSLSQPPPTQTLTPSPSPSPSASPSAFAPPRASTFNSPSNSSTSLITKWFGQKTFRATSSGQGSSKEIVFEKILNSVQEDGRLVEHLETTAKLRIIKNTLGQEMELIFNSQDVETHRVIRFRTPGVKNIMIYNRIGKHLEFRCSRAW